MASKNEQRKIEIIADGKKANASIKEMQAAVSLLNNQLNKLPQGTKEFADKAKELKEVKKRLQEVSAEAKSIGPAMQTGTKGTKLMATTTNLLKVAFQSAVAALLPLFAFQKLIELAQHFFSVSDEVNTLKGNIQSLTGASGDNLDGLTVQVRALGKTFDQDYNEILKSGNVLAQQMGISHEEAFKLIEKGLLAGVNLNGDFLEQISEYAPQFKAAGIEAEDFVAHLIRAEQEGIFSDKGADVIKEFGLRITEQAKATKDALDGAFGAEFTDELFSGINDGSVTTVEALQRVSKQMASSGASASQLQTVVADVFGGPGEDAGMEYLKSLQNIGGELDSMIDVTNALTARKIEQLGLEKELAAAQVELGAELGVLTSSYNTLWSNIQIYGTKALLGIIHAFEYLQELFENSDAALEGLKAGFIANIQGMHMAAFKYFSGIAELLMGVLTFDVDQIKAGFANAIGAYADHGRNVATAFQDAYEGALTSDQIAAREAKRLDKEREMELQKQKLHGEQTAEQNQQARDQEAIRLKAHQDKLAAEREKLRQIELAADRALQDLKLELMDEGLEREIEKINLEYERKWEAIAGNEQQIEEQRELMKQLWEEEKELKRQEFEQQKFEQEMLKLNEQEDMKKLALEARFLQALTTEQQRDMQMLNIKQAAAEARLELLRQSGKAESLEAQKISNEILAIEQAKVDQQIASEKRLTEEKERLEGLSYDASRDFLDLGIQLIENEQREKSKNASFFKGFTVGKILIDGAQEIQAIWKNANSNPLNALIPGFGAIQAAAQTALAVVRSKRAVSQVKGQGFYDGGFTGSGLSVSGAGKLLDNSGHAVAGVVHADEWVGPKWMVESPRYANVFRWLENQRTRRFAVGGETTAGAISRQPTPSGMGTPNSNAEQITSMFMQLGAMFERYASKVDHWARTLKVNNDPRDIQEGIQVMNEVDRDSDIS